MNESNRRDFIQKISAALLSLGLYGCGRSSPASDRASEALFKLLEAEAQSAVSQKQAVGISIGLQRRGFAPLFASAGTATLRSDEPLHSDTPLRVASVSKTFTAVATMLLVEQGKLRLDQPISDFFPNFPQGAAVTVYQLLSHTSGLKDWWEAGLPADTPGDLPQQPSPHRFLEEARDPFHFQPGEHHWYSNTGYVLLGDIIETVSKQRLGDYLNTRIFQPAKLKNTFFDPSPDQSAAWSTGHHLAPESASGFVETDFTGSPGAAGGIWSAARDLLLWSQSLYSGSILSQKTFSDMSEFARLRDGRPVYESTWYPSWMDTPPPESEFMETSGWGLGFSVFISQGQKVVWHSGGIPGYNAIWLNIPERSLSIALLSNTDNGAVPAFNNVVPQAVRA